MMTDSFLIYDSDSDHTAVRDIGVAGSSIEAGALDQEAVIQDYEMTNLPDVHATLSSSSSSSSSFIRSLMMMMMMIMMMIKWHGHPVELSFHNLE